MAFNLLQVKCNSDSRHCGRVAPWELGIKWLSFWPNCRVLLRQNALYDHRPEFLLGERGKEKQPWKLKSCFDISGNRFANLANSRSREIRSRFLKRMLISLTFVCSYIVIFWILWDTFRMDFSFLTCSICLSLITSWMARILRAKYSRLDRSRHRQTRAKVPAKTKSSLLNFFFNYRFSISTQAEADLRRDKSVDSSMNTTDLLLELIYSTSHKTIVNDYGLVY